MGAVKNLALDLSFEFEEVVGREPSWEELDEMFKMVLNHKISAREAALAMASDHPVEG